MIALDCRRAFGGVVAASVLGWAVVASAQELQTEYYLPFPETHVIETLDDVNAGTDGPVQSYTSITIPSACRVVYDHWEDGFEADASSPVQSSTEIWGDGDPSNGFPPEYPADVLAAGDVIVLRNAVSTDMDGGDGDPNDPANDVLLRGVIDYDGRDRIAASCALAVTRAGWASSGTLNAGATEVWPVSDWGDRYTIPVGQDTPGGDGNFEIANLSVTAARDGTTVRIDHTADGTADVTIGLNQGETYYVDSSSVAVNEGATVTASGPIQVALLTGDADSNYEGRWYGLLPESRWDSCYYAPTDGQPDAGVRVFLFNRGPAMVDVGVRNGPSVSTSIAIPPGETRFFDLSDDPVGAEFCSDDETGFYALAAVDHGHRDHDWGYTLVPGSALTNQLLVPWADGCDPTQSCAENGSPVWVMPVCDTNVFVDFDQDGTPDLVDLNGDGTTTSPDVDGKSEVTSDQGIPVSALERILIHDPSGSQTGALIYTLDDQGNPPGCDIAGVWGQNSAVASVASPGIDLGTLIPPFGPDLRLEKSTNGVDADTPAEAVVIPVGDPVVWRYRLTNTGDFAFTAIEVTDDQIPSSEIHCDASGVGGGSDGNGDNVIDRLEPGEVVECEAHGLAVAGPYANVGTATGLPVTIEGDPIHPIRTATDPSHYIGGDPQLSIAKHPAILIDDADGSGTVTALDTLEWPITVVNTGTVGLDGVVVKDPGADTLTCSREDGTPFDFSTGERVEASEAILCAATKVVSSDEVLAGEVVNTAIAECPDTGPVSDTQRTPTTPMSACAKGAVRDVLDPSSGRFPGNLGPDVVVVVDQGDSVQAAIDQITLEGDRNGDGYLIIAVEQSSGKAGGHTAENIVIDGSYALPFALIGCGTTLHNADPSAGVPTAHVTANAQSPDLYVMDLYADDSPVEGWRVEGDGRTLRNIRALKNAVGVRFVGSDNLFHNGVEVAWNSEAGIVLEGDRNVVTDARIESNGHGIVVRGNQNVLEKNDLGNCNASNLYDAIVIEGSDNQVRENDVFANYGNGIVVRGADNVLEKNDVGDSGKGNFGAGIVVESSGRADLVENRVSANLREGFWIEGGGTTFSKNQSGGSAPSDANVGCEFQVAGDHVNLGGNRAGGDTVDGDPFPTGCQGVTLPTETFESCAGVSTAPTWNGGTSSGSSSRSTAYVGPLEVLPTGIKMGTVGSKFKRTLGGVGGTPPYDWSGVGLPTGTTLGADGKISGTPEEGGLFVLAVTLRDAAGGVAQAAFTVQIDENLPELTTASLKDGEVGASFSRTVRAKNGVKPYQWAASGLPKGLTFDTAKGKVTGAPEEAGDFDLTFTVTDLYGRSAAVVLPVSIAPNVPVVSTAVLGNAKVGKTYKKTLKGKDGVKPYTWSGSVPPWLTLDPATGKIAGTPTAAGSWPLTVIVTDALGQQATRSLTVEAS